jgi:radical SAM superfamily enzyme YgiQ (UPF0313 family)
MPPIGLVSVAAYLERCGIATDVLDCILESDADARLRELLNDRQPAFVGFTCTTAGFRDAARMAQLARAVLPGVKTVMGGPHVSALTTRVLEEYPEVDFVVVGEGEATFAHLVESGGGSPDRVPGLVWRDRDGAVRFTGHREPIGDLDNLPYPAYEKLAGYPHAYCLPLFSYPRTPNGTCITSRGCPYACTYCDRSVFRRGYRFHSAAYVYEHLRYLRQRFGIRHVNIYDDQFTFDRRRIDELMGRLTAEPLDMTFNCAVRADHVEQDLLRRMKAAGCWMVSLGIESGDEELLSQHRQKADLDLVADRVREIKRAGLRAKGLFMMGLPGETEESIRRSMRYALSLPLDEMNLTKFTPFPGSPIYRRIRESGVFDEDWDLMDCMHFVFVPHGLTRERLDTLYREFNRRHFTRPRVWLGYAKLAIQAPDNWRRFAAHAAEYWRFARRA